LFYVFNICELSKINAMSTITIDHYDLLFIIYTIVIIQYYFAVTQSIRCAFYACCDGLYVIFKKMITLILSQDWSLFYLYVTDLSEAWLIHLYDNNSIMQYYQDAYIFAYFDLNNFWPRQSSSYSGVWHRFS